MSASSWYFSCAALMMKALTLTQAADSRKNRSVGCSSIPPKSTPSTSSTPTSMIAVPSQSDRYRRLR